MNVERHDLREIMSLLKLIIEFALQVASYVRDIDDYPHCAIAFQRKAVP